MRWVTWEGDKDNINGFPTLKEMTMCVTLRASHMTGEIALHFSPHQQHTLAQLVSLLARTGLGEASHYVQHGQ